MSAVSGVGEYCWELRFWLGDPEVLMLCIACILGSAVICADIVLRRIYRKDFEIVSNNVFLSASLCLSAGVMVSWKPTGERA